MLLHALCLKFLLATLSLATLAIGIGMSPITVAFVKFLMMMATAYTLRLGCRECDILKEHHILVRSEHFFHLLGVFTAPRFAVGALCPVIATIACSFLVTFNTFALYAVALANAWSTRAELPLVLLINFVDCCLLIHVEQDAFECDVGEFLRLVHFVVSALLAVGLIARVLVGILRAGRDAAQAESSNGKSDNFLVHVVCSVNLNSIQKLFLFVICCLDTSDRKRFTVQLSD